MKMFMLMIGKNLLEQVRDVKRNLLFVFIPMAIFIAVFGYFTANDIELNFVKPVSVGVVVEDSSPFSKLLVGDFKSKKNLSEFLIIVEGELEEISEAFNRKELDGYILIREGFIDNLLYFDYMPLEIKINNTDPVTTMILYGAFGAYENYIISVEKGVSAFYEELRDQVDKEDYWEYNDALSVELIMTMMNRNQMFDFHEVTTLPAVSGVFYYYVSLSVMFVFLMQLFLSVSLSDELKSDGFKRMLTTKISVYHYLAAKVVSNVLFVMVLFVIWSILFSIATQFVYTIFTFRIILYLLLVAFAAGLIGMLLSVLLDSSRDMILLSSVVVVTFGIIGGSIIPLHFMSLGLKELSKLTPNYYVIRTFLYESGGYVGHAYLLQSVLLFAGSIILFFLTGLIVNRKVRRTS